MSSNSSTIQDEFGNYEDWIELYNNSNDSIDLSQYFLTDDDLFLNKWQLPSEFIQPNEFVLIFASGAENLPFHANFK